MERVNCRVFAGLAALALSGGILVAAGPPAGAATQLCGSTCVTLITANYGSSEAMDVQSLQVAAGTAVDLAASGAYLAGRGLPPQLRGHHDPALGGWPGAHRGGEELAADHSGAHHGRNAVPVLAGPRRRALTAAVPTAPRLNG
jgi:hypothetical protein